MAQTKRKRRRKHRGTQTGRIDTRGRRGRPRSREEAKAQARRRGESRRDLAPTWGSAFRRGLFGAGIFLLLIWLAFGYSFGGSLALSAVMLAMYVPLGYYVDRFFYARRRARERAQKTAR
jgi:Flp pilus assembly protein TadB